MKKYEIERQFQHDVLVGFGARPDIWIWRQNTGMFYGFNAVKAAMALLFRGQVEKAIEVMKKMQPVRCGIPGQADIGGMVVGSGRIIGWECKDEGEKRTDVQVRWGKEFEANGGFYVLATQCWEIQVALWELGLT